MMGLSPQSDNVGYYSEAKAALAGGIIYRDFASSYGPLFTYLDAAAVYIWDSPKSIVLLSIIVELTFYPLWFNLARLTLGENLARISSTLYILSPLPLFVIAVNGQNQSFGAAYLFLTFCLLVRGRNGWAGFVMGLSIPGVKFLMGLFTPVAYVFARHRLRFLAAFLLPLIFCYGLLLLRGADLTVPLQIQANDQTSGNLPFFLGLMVFNASSITTRRIFDSFTLASLAVVFLIHTLRVRTQPVWLICLCTIIGLTFMLCSKKSYTNYLVLFYFPFCMTVAANGFSILRAIFFGIFNLCAVLEPSLYYRWVLPLSDTTVPSLAFISAAHRNPLYITTTFLLCDLFLVCDYSLYLLGTWRLLSRRLAMNEECGLPPMSQVA
jgi:hypothetical protein